MTLSNYDRRNNLLYKTFLSKEEKDELNSLNNEYENNKTKEDRRWCLLYKKLEENLSTEEAEELEILESKFNDSNLTIVSTAKLVEIERSF